MPVTIAIASHPSNPYKPPAASPTTPGELIDGLGDGYACKKVIQHSTPMEDIAYLTPHRNGFVRSVLDAYAGHHHVVIRPDDVWIAILSQVNH